MNTVKVEIDISNLLDVNGVETYIYDIETPAFKTSIESLVVEFLESREINGEYQDKEDIQKVRDSFQRGLDSLNNALKNT